MSRLAGAFLREHRSLWEKLAAGRVLAGDPEGRYGVVQRNVETLINPKSIAVVGASSRPGTVGNDVLKNLLQGGYQGVVFPVNPKRSFVHAIKAYPSLLAVPDPVDMAVVIVPAAAVPGVVEEAGQKGVRGVVVISAGFKEAGPEGAKLQREVVARARAAKMALIGPNCLGVINTDPAVSMNASFGRRMPRQGNIAFISQSGALCTSVLDFAEERQFGFSKFISFGNKADVNEVDLLDYLKDDPQTQVILMYLEDITDGRQFVETARTITWDYRKPILAIKSGRSVEGARAASSHTGSLAGSDAAYDAVFFQSGVQRCETIAELFDYAAGYSTQPLPSGDKIAIVTNAGGPGIMATDAAIRHGLKLAQLSPQTCEKLAESLPPNASLANPVDVIGDATHERYEAAIRAVLEDDNVDGALLILTPQSVTEPTATAEIVPRVRQGINKPVLCSFMGVGDVSEGVRYLQQHQVPNYPFPEDAVRTLASMVRFAGLLRLEHREFVHYEVDLAGAQEIVRGALADKPRYYMTQVEANRLLACYGLPVLFGRLCRSHEDVRTACDELREPWVMKIMSPDVVHKVDVGGVKLDLWNLPEALRAYDAIIANVLEAVPEARVDGVLLEEMAPKGVEVIIGANREPKFGPMVMFGLGGTLVEVLRDVTFRIAPMWRISAELMVRQIKAYQVLEGIRNTPPADVEAIVDCILRVAQMVHELPQIQELDINPLIVHGRGQGCAVADSRILLAR